MSSYGDDDSVASSGLRRDSAVEAALAQVFLTVTTDSFFPSSNPPICELLQSILPEAVSVTINPGSNATTPIALPDCAYGLLWSASTFSVNYVAILAEPGDGPGADPLIRLAMAINSSTALSMVSSSFLSSSGSILPRAIDWNLALSDHFTLLRSVSFNGVNMASWAGNPVGPTLPDSLPARFTSWLMPNCNVTGSIPSTFLQNHNVSNGALFVLSLSNNAHLSGPLPASLFTSASPLAYLLADSTGISGPMPDLGLLQAPHLRYLLLNNDRLINFCSFSNPWIGSTNLICQLRNTNAGTCAGKYPTSCAVDFVPQAPSPPIPPIPVSPPLDIAPIFTPIFTPINVPVEIITPVTIPESIIPIATPVFIEEPTTSVPTPVYEPFAEPQASNTPSSSPQSEPETLSPQSSSPVDVAPSVPTGGWITLFYDESPQWPCDEVALYQPIGLTLYGGLVAVLPDCFYELSYGLDTLGLVDVIVRANATYPDPLVRLTRSLPIARTLALDHSLLQSPSNVTQTSVNWPSTLNQIPSILSIVFEGLELPRTILPDSLPSQLWSFGVPSCDIEGSLPSTLLDFITSDFSLDVSDNPRMNGTLPAKWFSSTSTLSFLSAGFTGLNGVMPNMGQLRAPQLVSLTLDDTDIDFCSGANRTVWTGGTWFSECSLTQTNANTCSGQYPFICDMDPTPPTSAPVESPSTPSPVDIPQWMPINEPSSVPVNEPVVEPVYYAPVTVPTAPIAAPIASPVPVAPTPVPVGPAPVAPTPQSEGGQGGHLSITFSSAWNNQTFAMLLCDVVASFGPSSLSVSRGSGNGKLLLPDCFYPLARPIKVLSLSNVMVQGSWADAHPLERLGKAAESAVGISVVSSILLDPYGRPASAVTWSNFFVDTPELKSISLQDTPLGIGAKLPASLPPRFFSFNVANTGISGSIPNTIFSLYTNYLTPAPGVALDISSNPGISGVLPSQLFYGPFLTSLRAGFTSLSGPMPDMSWLSTGTLRDLALQSTGIDFCSPSSRAPWRSAYLALCTLEATNAIGCSSNYPPVCFGAPYVIGSSSSSSQRSVRSDGWEETIIASNLPIRTSASPRTAAILASAPANAAKADELARKANSKAPIVAKATTNPRDFSAASSVSVSAGAMIAMISVAILALL